MPISERIARAYRRNRAKGDSPKSAIWAARVAETMPVEDARYDAEELNATLPEGYTIAFRFLDDNHGDLLDGDTWNDFDLVKLSAGRPDGHAGVDYVEAGDYYVTTPRELFDQWVSWKRHHGTHKSQAIEEARAMMRDNAETFLQLREGDIRPMIFEAELYDDQGQEVARDSICGIEDTPEGRLYAFGEYGREFIATLAERAQFHAFKHVKQL